MTDERYKLFPFLDNGDRFGAERIRLNQAETGALERALAILTRLRDVRAEQYHARGHGETEGLAGDIADDDDDLRLGLAAAALSDVITTGRRTDDDTLSYDLPEEA